MVFFRVTTLYFAIDDILVRQFIWWKFLALADLERDRLLVPSISGCLLECWARQVNVPRLAILGRADVHNLDLDRSPPTFDGGTLSAGPSGLLEVLLVQGRVVRVPLLAQFLRVEAACISAGTVDLNRLIEMCT